MGHDRADTKRSNKLVKEESLGEKILSRLTRSLSINPRDFVVDSAVKLSGDPFAILVATVLSQNTNDKNSLRALENLNGKIGLSPSKLANASIKDVEEAIKIAGLYKAKAARIVELAKIVLRELNGDLTKILKLPLKEARSKLLSLPGVGPKTADVVLLIASGKPVFPVDTHIARVSKRLGIVPRNAGYEEIRNTLENIFDPKDYLLAHKLLIAHGRTFCKARNPRCDECPLSDICAWSKRRTVVSANC